MKINWLEFTKLICLKLISLRSYHIDALTNVVGAVKADSLRFFDIEALIHLIEAFKSLC